MTSIRIPPLRRRSQPAVLAGLTTALLHLRFNIQHLLASILTMIALYSINLRVMGRPNIAILNQPTILSPFENLGLPEVYLKPVAAFVIVATVGLLLSRFLISDFGLGLRAAGANTRMSRAMGVSPAVAVCLGMAVSNAVVAMAGALFAQMNGFADISIGTGTIIVGLASVVVGEVIVRRRGMLAVVIACIFGAVLYRLVVTLALNADFLGLRASDLNLVTAILVALALILPAARNPVKALFARRAPS